MKEQIYKLKVKELIEISKSNKSAINLSLEHRSSRKSLKKSLQLNKLPKGPRRETRNNKSELRQPT